MREDVSLSRTVEKCFPGDVDPAVHVSLNISRAIYSATNMAS